MKLKSKLGATTTAPKSSKIKNQRATSWTMIVYPESAPEDWKQLLKDQHIKFIISPLHDKDTFKNGKTKKAHWHVILVFNSLKSFKQVKEISDMLNAPRPQVVNDMSMMVQYLWHANDPDKYQYSKEDVEIYGNIDLEKYLETSDEHYGVYKQMFEFVKKNDVVEFQDLVDEAINEHPKWFELICDHNVYFIELYIRSQRNRLKK